MICSIGIRTLVQAQVDFANSRNLVIAAVILVLGIGGATITITEDLQFGGLALAAIVEIILNKLLPEGVGAHVDEELSKAGD